MQTTTAPKLLAHASVTEGRIARAIVRDALAKGWSVSVYDGEEWSLKKATAHNTILAAMNSTGLDRLRFRDADDNIVGSVDLIWGNDEDLLSDHSDNEAINAFVEQGKYH